MEFVFYVKNGKGLLAAKYGYCICIKCIQHYNSLYEHPRIHQSIPKLLFKIELQLTRYFTVKIKNRI